MTVMNLADILKARTLRIKTFRSFIPIIILPIMLMGIFSYVLASIQIKKNMYSNFTDAVSQTRKHLDNSMTLITEQLVQLSNDIDMMSIITSLQFNKRVDKPNLYLKADKSLGRICSSYYNIIESIYLNVNDGEFIVSLIANGKALAFLNKISVDQLVDTYDCGKAGYYWLNLHKDMIFQDAKQVASLLWVFGQSNSQVKGILLFNLKEEFFRQILGSDSIGKNGYITIISPDGLMCFKQFDQKYRLDDNITDEILYATHLSGKIEKKNQYGQELFIAYDTMKVNGWKVVVAAPKDEIISNLNYIMYFTIIIMFILIITAVIVSNHLSRAITEPLSRLTKKVEEVGEGNLDIDFDAGMEFETEVDVLNKGIGELIVRIKELIGKIEEEHKNKRIAEIKALQAQIKPHFLYNTLDSARHLCEIGASKEASNIISYISNFYRIGISKGQEDILIADEIKHVRNYLLVQHMQYNELFDYEFQINQNILKNRIIKIILQPLVENALHHGLKNKYVKGQIIIMGYSKDDCIYFKIKDNGAGIPIQQLERINKCLKGVDSYEFMNCTYGLWNVHQRLQLKYGKDYGLAIESVEGEYTDVTVCIPFEDIRSETNV